MESKTYEDDGFLEVQVKPKTTPATDGNPEVVEGVAPVQLDVYLVGTELTDAGIAWKAEGDTGSGMLNKAKEIFARHGLPNISGRLVLELMNDILVRTEDIEKKYGATKAPS